VASGISVLAVQELQISVGAVFVAVSAGTIFVAVSAGTMFVAVSPGTMFVAALSRDAADEDKDEDEDEDDDDDDDDWEEDEDADEGGGKGVEFALLRLDAGVDFTFAWASGGFTEHLDRKFHSEQMAQWSDGNRPVSAIRRFPRRRNDVGHQPAVFSSILKPFTAGFSVRFASVFSDGKFRAGMYRNRSNRQLVLLPLGGP